MWLYRQYQMLPKGLIKSRKCELDHDQIIPSHQFICYKICGIYFDNVINTDVDILFW